MGHKLILSDGRMRVDHEPKVDLAVFHLHGGGAGAGAKNGLHAVREAVGDGFARLNVGERGADAFADRFLKAIVEIEHRVVHPDGKGLDIHVEIERRANVVVGDAVFGDAEVEFDEQFNTGEVDGEAADEFDTIVFESEVQAERAASVGGRAGEEAKAEGITADIGDLFHNLNLWKQRRRDAAVKGRNRKAEITETEIGGEAKGAGVTAMLEVNGIAAVEAAGNGFQEMGWEGTGLEVADAGE